MRFLRFLLFLVLMIPILVWALAVVILGCPFLLYGASVDAFEGGEEGWKWMDGVFNVAFWPMALLERIGVWK